MPLALGLERLPAGAAGRGPAARLGAVAGTVGWALLLPWTWAALAATPVWGTLAFAALVGAFAALTAGVLVAAHALRSARVPAALALPLAWVAGEWLRGHLGPFAFPWLPLANGLTGLPALLGLAPWVGASGVGLWLALPQGAWAGWLSAPGASRSALAGRAVGTAAWLASGVLAWPAPAPAGPTLDVLIVQPDLPVRGDPRATAERALARAGRAVEGRRADLVVLPEGALPVDVPRSPTVVAALAGLAEQSGGAVVVGALGQGVPGMPGARTNRVHLVRADGLDPVEYDKRRLVPILERTPFLPVGGDLTAGRSPGVLEVAGVRAGVLVCYESIFPELARDLARGGAGFLLNPTNDAWYRARGAGTSGLLQHPAHLVFRAIETGRPAVRVANTGPSFLVDARGRLAAVTPLRTDTLLALRVPTVTGPATPFTRTGDLVGPFAAGAVLLLWAAARRRG